MRDRGVRRIQRFRDPVEAQLYDVIVVGAGSAGCALARRLGDGGRSVLLVEAGNDYGRLEDFPSPLRRGFSFSSNVPGDPHSWSYTGRITPELTYPITRGKVVGGSSAVNGGQFVRGIPADYDAWAEAGNTAWAYRELLPYFRRLEQDRDFPQSPWHGTEGPINVVRPSERELSPVAHAFVEACLATGHPWDGDLNAPDSTGVGYIPHNIVDGVRQATGALYLDPTTRPTNLTVLDRALATRILFEGDRAVGVSLIRDRNSLVVRGEEIVLSAGALNSPHLLLLSGIGPEEELRRHGIPVREDLPVGRWLMDHPSISVTYTQTGDRAAAPQGLLAHVCLNYSSSAGTGDADDLRIFPYNYPKQRIVFGAAGDGWRAGLRRFAFLRHPVVAARAVRATSRAALAHDIQHRADLAFHCALTVEESRGALKLTSADARDAVEIDYGYLATGNDRRRAREVVRAARELLQHAAFQRLDVELTGLTDAEAGSDADLDRWLQAHTGTSYHTAGTCRMGPPDRDGAVVDQYCRVYGVEGLRVVDISIMPRIVRRGTNASAVMIGERAAEFFHA